MSDIVGRARALQSIHPEPEPFEIWREAVGVALACADETVRLRAENKAFQEANRKFAQRELTQLNQMFELEQQRDALKAEMLREREDHRQSVEDAASVLRELRAAEAERDAFRDTATARDRNEDALRADAERYRWLRDHAPEKWAPWADERDDGNCTSDEIDAAIDAAMKEKRE